LLPSNAVASSFRRSHLTPIPASRPPTPVLALPGEAHPAWAGLVEGAICYDWGYAAAGMLIFNLNLQWKRDPSRLPQLVGQLRSFFQRYHSLLGHDIAKVFT
jgi:hypothetical protein